MIQIFAPVDKRSLRGNAVTVKRWRDLFRELQFQSHIHYDQTDQFDVHKDAELFVFVHATRSARLMQFAKRRRPDVPRVLCLSGTDIHRDLASGSGTKAFSLARASIEMANRIVTLDSESIHSIRVKKLREMAWRKSAVIYQSCVPSNAKITRLKRCFEVSVIGHLRKEKDPYCAALASERLPPESRIRVVQVGNALTESAAAKASKHSQQMPRYRWVGGKSHANTIRILRRSRVTLITSLMESGSNLISEAVVNEVPILATRIPGNVGVLGKSYPGYFKVNDPDSLATILQRFEFDLEFQLEIGKAVRAIVEQFHPDEERNRWCALMTELGIQPTLS